MLRQSGVGKWEGHGIARVENCNYVKEGYWNNGHPHIKARFIYPDGIIYEGEVRGGQLHGKGTRFDIDGSNYQG